MRITLSGDLGSGKSSVGRRLAERLGIPHYSAGSLFREIGQISNLDALRTNLAAEDNVDIDHAVDDRTRELDRSVDRFIIDSRMAWHFVSGATKVYLSVAPETAAARVISDGTRSNETYDSVASAMAALAERRQSETKRYRKLYGVDITDVANYDLFIITDDATIDDIADVVLAFADGRTSEKFWLPKTRIVPMIAEDGVGAAAPAPTSLADDFRLALKVAGNFGFFFGDAPALASAFAFELPLVPYAPHDGTAREPDADLIALARRTVTPRGISHWENRFGVKLAFAEQLKSHSAA